METNRINAGSYYVGHSQFIFMCFANKKNPKLEKLKNSHPTSVETMRYPQKCSCRSIVSQCANGNIQFLNPPIIQDHEVLKQTWHNIKWTSTPNICIVQNFVLHING